MADQSSHAVRQTFGLRLLRASRLWRREANETLARYGLSESSVLPLMLLAELGSGLRQGMLAAELGIEGPSLVRLLDQLAIDGLLERREDPTDRRARTIHLTEDGRGMVRRVREVLGEMRRRLLDGTDDAAVEACLNVFAHIESKSRTSAGVEAQDARAEEAS